jgi:hypothetical protein
LPVKAVKDADGQIGEVNTDAMYDHVVNKFDWGRMDDPAVKIDDNNARMIMNMRNILGRLSQALIREGKTDSARIVIDLCLEKMPDSKVPYDYFSLPAAEGLYRLGDTDRANEIARNLASAKSEELAYLFSFPDKDLKELDLHMQEALFTLNRLAEMTGESGQREISDQAQKTLEQYYDMYIQKVYRP